MKNKMFCPAIIICSLFGVRCTEDQKMDYLYQITLKLILIIQIIKLIYSFSLKQASALMNMFIKTKIRVTKPQSTKVPI